MDQALIEHAKNDVDRQQRSEDQHRPIVGGVLDGLGVPRKIRAHPGREAQVGDGALQRRIGLLRHHTGRCGVVDGDGGELAGMIDRQGRRPALHPRQRAQGNLHAACTRHEEPRKVAGIALARLRHLQHHLVLIAITIDGRNLPLTECVREHIVDGGDIDAHARSGRPVDHHPGLQPSLFAVA